MQEYSKLLESELEETISEKQKEIQKQAEKIESLEAELRDFKLRYQKNQSEITQLNKEVYYLKSTLRIFEEQKRELEDLNDQWENSNRILEYSKQDLEERLYQAEESVIMYKEELGEVATQKEIEVQRLRDEIKDLKQELLIVLNQHGEKSKIQELEASLNKALEEMTALKKNNSDEVAKEKLNCNNVSVYAKLRPVLDNDSNKLVVLNTINNEIIVNPIKEKTKNPSLRSFTFEKVYGIHDSLERLFEDIKPSISHFAGGGSCCIISYGQTGSGKTYTMNGLISKTLGFLASTVPKESQITLHCIEVYNEQVRDLLSDSGLSKNWKNIVSIYAKTLHENWTQMASDYLKIASNKRYTKSTDLNEMSSRSHCIYTFILNSQKNCVLQFVDLAGSERIYKSGVVGDTLKETLHINRSLSALQDVIAALETKSSHVPYRNSLLTRILKPSLAGFSSKVTVILNCSPTEDNLNESLSTLSLGTRLKSVDLAWAIRKNLKNEEVERTLTLLEKERSEKNVLSRKIDKLERDIEVYMSVLKEKDHKIHTLTNKLKQIEKSHAEENDLLRKELQNLKNKQQETDKKIRTIRAQIEKEKTKPKLHQQITVKSELTNKRVMSADPYTLKKPAEAKSHTKTPTPSRIPKPGSNSLNSTVINIISA